MSCVSQMQRKKGEINLMELLSGKKAVITGGSDGIGLSIAKSFVENGANVMLIARDQSKLNKAVTEISFENTEVKTLTADLSDISSFSGLSQKILDIWPCIDVLVNNAGTARFTPYDEVQQDELDLHINLNIKAPFILTQLLMPALEKRNGNIINISSFFSHRMLPGRPSTAYSLTKGAIDSFTKALAYEVGSKKIRVNAIAPGTVNTALVRSNIDKLTPDGKEKFFDMIKTIYPLGRIGEPEDLGGIASFLASDQAKWITGTIVSVDGGLTTN